MLGNALAIFPRQDGTGPAGLGWGGSTPARGRREAQSGGRTAATGNGPGSVGGRSVIVLMGVSFRPFGKRTPLFWRPKPPADMQLTYGLGQRKPENECSYSRYGCLRTGSAERPSALQRETDHRRVPPSRRTMRSFDPGPPVREPSDQADAELIQARLVEGKNV